LRVRLLRDNRYSLCPITKSDGLRLAERLAVDDERRSFALIVSPLYRPATGFFATVERFVFVSAFLAGMLFRKRAEKLGFAAARSSSIHRAARIYRAHLVTLCFAFTLGSFF